MRALDFSRLPSALTLKDHRVLVVGDAMLDRYWWGEVERISPEAPVPIVRVVREEDRLGGAANVALNVQTLGAACTLITALGEDPAGTRLRELLSRSDIEVMAAGDAGLRNIVKLRVIGRSQQVIRIDFESPAEHEVLDGMLGQFDAALARCDVVLFSDYGKGGLGHISRMTELAVSSGKPVLVDPKGKEFSKYRNATVVSPNRGELAAVVGSWRSEAELEEKAQNLRASLNIGAVLLTRSEEGMSLFDGDGHLRIEALSKDVYDVTGAGDTVIACMAALMSCGMAVREAVHYANRAGGIVVGKFGTSTVSLDELLRKAPSP